MIGLRWRQPPRHRGGGGGRGGRRGSTRRTAGRTSRTGKYPGEGFGKWQRNSWAKFHMVKVLDVSSFMWNMRCLEVVECYLPDGEGEGEAVGEQLTNHPQQ